MLGLHGGSVVAAETLVELLWGEDPPRTAAKALQTHISSLRRTLGDGFVLTAGAGWILAETQVDAARYKSAARLGRDAAAAGDHSQAVARFEEALALWRGTPELPDGRRGTSEKTRWIEGHAALVEDRADALLATGRAAEIIGELEAAVADAPLRERRWGQLMLALYRAGRQGEALGAYQRARALLADELGVDPGPELRRLEAAIVAQDSALETPAAQQFSSVTRAVTFLLTDIEGSTAAWEADAEAMAVALARHDELVEQVVTSRGGRLIKTRGEGDATFSVFERPSAAAAAAIELQDAIVHEPWALREPMRVRVALHTGEVELRDGDYFGRAVNRAARLRSLAAGGQILCSGATAELVIDSLPDDVVLADLGTRQLRNLARPEHVFELRLHGAEEPGEDAPTEAPLERPSLPAVLGGRGPFVGRGDELERLSAAWHTALAGGTNAMLIAGEPGVGKTRLAGEWSRQAYDQGALVIYGRCDEDLGAPYQPFAEALRSLVPCLGAGALRGLRGVEALLTLVPGLTDVLPDVSAPTRADPDTERYALFDAVVGLLAMASASAPVVLILDDLHWAAKPTLLLLRHLLRFGEHARVQIIGTYRSTDLDRSHPLAAMLADLHRDGTANRLALSGLDEDDVTAYVAEAGYNDEELARALASVTGGNPFFLIEALRHVDESGGRWDQSTLPQGVREAVSRRLSRLPAEANKALAAAAVVGSRFALELVERVVGDDLVDAFDEACKAGIVIEEAGGRYRFNHAIVRQSLLAELPSVRRMRLHQRIATTLEEEPGADDELLAELAYHYFECAWAGNAAKAVEYCRRAADQAMARLAYEGAADLYDRALHALEEIDEELPDRDDQVAALLITRCEALLAAGDVTSAANAVTQLQTDTVGSPHLAAWATCFDGQLSMLIHPERLDEVEAAVGAAADKLAELGDAAGEAKAHTVRAGCLARLGRIGDCEVALDEALTAARRAREHRRVNAVLANAPLAALWGPNPVPRAGGRCLDVVRLLRITTDSPAVEATSTRCQAVLEAFRGRAAAARRMIDSARRTVSELGLRHALMEVEQFAGIVELVVDEPLAAEPHLRKAYNGFRRMGLDADTAETAALLGRTCLALGNDDEAAELCAESERLAGHALKASIAWRTLRARLLSRGGDHGQARRVAEEAVALAERTDALVDHADACLALATVLGAVGDVAGARAAAERAVELYERKGAGALAERARLILGSEPPPAPVSPEPPVVELENACVRAGERVVSAIDRQARDELEELFSARPFIESRRKVVGFTQSDLSSDWLEANRPILEAGDMRISQVVIAVRGERLALSRLRVDSGDVSAGAPYDEFLSLYGIDDESRISLQIWFDVDDLDAAMAELDAQFQAEHPTARRLENTATRVFEAEWKHFAARDWRAMAELVADDYVGIDHRRVVSAETQHSRDEVVRDLQAAADVGFAISMVSAVAIRGQRLVLARVRASGRDPAAAENDALNVVEIDEDDRIASVVTFDLEDIESAVNELDARFAAGEGSRYARTWSVVTSALTAHNRRELPAATPDAVTIDHRRVATFAPGEGLEYLRAGWDLDQQLDIYVETEHRLNDQGAVFTWAGHGTSHDGFTAEWRGVDLMMVDGEMISRVEVFEEADLDAAIEKFEKLSRPAPRLENVASRAYQRLLGLLTTQDWDALGALVAPELFNDDRRRVVNAGVRHGRSAGIEQVRSLAAVGFTLTLVRVEAIRGASLALVRMRASGRDPETVQNDALNILEVDAEGRINAVVVYDLHDVDSALAELDARYLAGEAAAHAHTWSVITQAYATLNRYEMPETTTDFVSADHRRGAAFAPGDLIAYVRAAWNLAQQGTTHIETVHRLTDVGAIVTHVTRGTSQKGFEAEWRELVLLTLDGDLLSRCELFGEEDLDLAIARFDKLTQPALQLENAASQMHKRLQSVFAARDWDTMSAVMADDIRLDDRRRTVNSGIREGSAAILEEMSATVRIGVKTMTSDVVAVRGDRLALCRSQTWGRDTGPEAFHTDVFDVFELDAAGKVSARIVFDLDDFDAAVAELDARYLAGEASAHSHTWSLVTEAFAALNQRRIPKTTPDWASIDHRRLASIGSGDLGAYLLASWELSPKSQIYVAAVHRLSSVGAVLTHVAIGTSPDGFDAEWQVIDVMIFDGDQISRSELFDETDLDAALARLDELSRPTSPLQNPASQVVHGFLAHFATRNWEAIAEAMADQYLVDDRRRTVNAGVRRGRDAAVDDFRAAADVGFTEATSTVIATRGTHLALTVVRFSSTDRRPGSFKIETLVVAEINARNRLANAVVFEPDDFDAAIAELDARYLAGEAAAHAQIWSAITRSFSSINRREMPATTSDWVNIDHRRGTSIAPGEMAALMGAAWSSGSDLRCFIEWVHRLSDRGVVITHVAHETSREGFHAEWRVISVITVEGDLINRTEVFDEASLAAAIARFDQLNQPAPRLENAASRVGKRYLARFAAADWDAMAEMLAEDFTNDDRRRVVGSGMQQGRDAQIADMQTVADLWTRNVTPTVMAIRGERLALMRLRFADQKQGPDAFLTEALGVLEINADDRIVAVVFFDDVTAAFEELDTRYLAGEAAAHARAWSVIVAGYAALNRHELPSTTTDFASIDHRRGAAHAPGELVDYVRAGWELDQKIRTYPEVVHRLSDVGAVYTHVAHGTSRDGFDAEWRGISLTTVEGDLVSRSEVFDETDLDAAIARFEQLSEPTSRPENAASRTYERIKAAYATGDMHSIAGLLADDVWTEDRRHVVNAGLRKGPDAVITEISGLYEGAVEVMTEVVATRGDRLVLSRIRSTLHGDGAEGFHSVGLDILEIDANGRVATRIVFDREDIDAAFDELDARYVAGEARPHAHTWSVIADIYALFNRQELPAVDWVIVDHRRGTPFASGELNPALQSFFDLTPEFRVTIETVHRLNDFGAVVTIDSQGSSRDGLDVEWRMIQLLVVEGDRLTRCELFDDTDLDAAFERFIQLTQSPAQPDNATTRVVQHFLTRFAVRDWDAMAELIADDFCSDDRRSVVNAGIQRGREVELANWRATAEVWMSDVRAAVVATRGERLALFRFTFASQDPLPASSQAAAVSVVELNDDNRCAATVVFDPDDIDAAFDELDARYLAGDAAAYARTWSAISGAYAAINRRQLPMMTTDFADIDHRRGAAWAPGELVEFLRSALDQTPNLTIRIAAVHRLNGQGAVVTHAANGTSPDGFDAEWREILFLIVDGDMLKHCEVFDEADLDAAFARFEELYRPTVRRENTATRVAGRFFANVQARDWTAIAQTMADDGCIDDRRRVVNGGRWDGRDVVIANIRAIGVGGANIAWSVIAIRGERLALTRISSSNLGLRHGEFENEMLGIAEIDADDRMKAQVLFDAHDVEAAFAELEARYMVGEAAGSSRAWSVIAQAYAAVNRGELPSTTPDWTNIDHRRGIAFPPGNLEAYLEASWDLLAPGLNTYIEIVHRLTDIGAVVTRVIEGTSSDGFQAEWREIGISTVEGDLISRSEIFDETDLDRALARFEELQPRVRRLENAATQVSERFWRSLMTRDWAAMAEILAENVVSHDNRRVVNSGELRGRETNLANVRAVAEVGFEGVESTLLAIRGQRLALFRIRSSAHGLEPGEISADMTGVVETDVDNRMITHSIFDAEDFDAAFAELEARYMAGEGANHARMWSLITQGHAQFNRHELPTMTPDVVYVDHRRGVTIEGADLATSVRAGWDLLPQVHAYVATVHRVTELGAIATQVVNATSKEGFDAEWLMITIFTFEGDLLSRYEVFDEAELDTALARFDELHQQPRRLENAASRAHDRFFTYFQARNWVAIAEILADDGFIDDRHDVVNSGFWDGRDAVITNLQALAEAAPATWTATAIRGERLTLTRICSPSRDQEHGEFSIEMLIVAEIDTNERIVAQLAFDVEDIDAAFAELESRYLAGEAADHADTWSLMVSTYATLNRHEIPTISTDFVNIDHRRGIKFEPGNIVRYVQATWEIAPDLKMYIEKVHRLTDAGSVITHSGYGTSHEGFDAEWRETILYTCRDGVMNRCEMFDEEDLEAALARFEELQPHARRLENAATLIDQRFWEHYAVGDWAAVAATLANDMTNDDRRSIVNAGIRRGRESEVANMRALSDMGVTTVTSTIIATRGDRLLLRRTRFSLDEGPEDFNAELLCVVELDAANRIATRVLFDPDDADAAFEELDARYLAGEAAAHARTWSIIAGSYASMNRRELFPTTPDWVNIDHRRPGMFEEGGLKASLRSLWQLTSDLTFRIVAVHRLTDAGMVCSHVAQGVSHHGFDAEWRGIEVQTIEGDRINRCEIFDQEDLDAALARFDEITAARPVGD
ncbi:hypothetical protein A5730_05190 [Mycobacterium sp. ACS4054]|uniref:BTAD domain-containing putative transcriptional regulator n=1 Tax=Mycobacterium sp. ACS4054 TaxID=1834119 RepID=UPI0007FF5048|nr:hypothetical protein A5730_05190 [Mycobacterium sp. ACS4054]